MADEEENHEIPPPTVFIHCADTFFGRILTQHLGQSLPGSAQSESNEALDKAAATPKEFLEAPPKPNAYKLIGSVQRPLPEDEFQDPKPVVSIPCLSQKFYTGDDQELATTLVSADAYVFHLVDEDGQNGIFECSKRAIEAAEKYISENKVKKTIVLVSNLMSWANAKRPVNPDEEAEAEEPTPFSEEDHKIRRPHDNFKHFHELERRLYVLGRKYRRRVKVTVIGAGVLYGMGENQLHEFFKRAWHNEISIPIVGEGINRFPMIHVRDLCRVVQVSVDGSLETPYIIAVDDGNHTLSSVITKLSSELTTGLTTIVTPTEAVQQKLISQFFLDLLTTNLLLEAASVKESIRWTSQEGFVSYTAKAEREYRSVRELNPIKLAVYCSPNSQAKQLAKKLCEFYKLHYISPETTVGDTEKQLTDFVELSSKIPPKKPVENADEDPAEDATVSRLKKATELLEQIKASKEADENTRNDLVLTLIREMISGKKACNQGYVLDGFPKTKEDAMKLFAPNEADGEQEEEEVSDEPTDEEENSEVPPYNRKTIPDFVFYLETGAETDGRSDNPIGAFAFFDEIEDYVIWLQEPKGNLDGDYILKKILGRVGKPRNYGISDEERRKRVQEKQELFLKKQADQRQKHKLDEETERETTAAKRTQWLKLKELLKEQDYSKRELEKTPMHEYLLRFVLPDLYEGLLACAKLKPKDPVDFIAEFLLQKCKGDALDIKDFFPANSNMSALENQQTASGARSMEEFVSAIAHLVERSGSSVDVEHLHDFVSQAAHVYPGVFENDGSEQQVSFDVEKAGD